MFNQQTAKDLLQKGLRVALPVTILEIITNFDVQSNKKHKHLKKWAIVLCVKPRIVAGPRNLMFWVTLRSRIERITQK